MFLMDPFEPNPFSSVAIALNLTRSQLAKLLLFRDFVNALGKNKNSTVESIVQKEAAKYPYKAKKSFQVINKVFFLVSES